MRHAHARMLFGIFVLHTMPFGTQRRRKFVWHVHVLPMFTESEQEELMNAVATQYSLSATAGEVFVLHINKVLTIIFWYVI